MQPNNLKQIATTFYDYLNKAAPTKRQVALEKTKIRQKKVQKEPIRHMAYRPNQ